MSLEARVPISDLGAARKDFAREITSCGKTHSPRLMRAFAAVPREQFLGKGPWRLRTLTGQYTRTVDANPIHLYQDVRVAIDARRRLDNGLPSLWAEAFAALDIKAGARILQIGCGTGYYSAILAELVGPSGQVVALDCESGFVRQAQRNLKRYANIEVRHADACQALGDTADIIIAHAGFAQAHPQWLDALNPRGRLLLPLTNRSRQGTLFKITRLGRGYSALALAGIEIIPGRGWATPAASARVARWLDAKFSVRSLRRDAHRKDHTCWLHQVSSCWSKRAPAEEGRRNQPNRPPDAH
jgi:protein-L-isoaspartate(D-aspartate) O-methyltransferase